MKTAALKTALGCVVLAAWAVAASGSDQMQQLGNDRICFSLSPDGRKFELGYAGEAASLTGDRGLFDMMIGCGQRHEWGIDPDVQTAVVTKEGAALVARYAKLRHAGKEHDLSVELRFTLEGDGVVCEALLQNNSDLTVEEFWFPWVGPFRGLATDPTRDTLILPEGFGRRVQNPSAYVQRFQTGYMAPDQKRILACSYYPGGWMTMGWFGFYGDGKALGFLSLDNSFQTTGLNVARDTQTGLLSAGFTRYPFLKRGTWRSPRSLVRLHHNDWHDDARTYRNWVNTSWWSQSPRPRWVDQMHGWQRIIMKHQYGEIFYRYSDLVDVFEAGRPYGITTLFVFGWFSGGMDNGYPEYRADAELGGETALREAITEVQKRGGRVILYANGHLIDVDSDYYQQVGKRICLKTSQGSEYREAYKFSGDGTFLREFGARSFVAACQSTPEWCAKLIEIGRYMASFGADGIFFDQMGGHVPYLCFDSSHPHAGPALAQGPGKDANLAAIRRALIDGHPDRTFGTELASDCLNRHVDFVHTATFGMSPHPEAMPEMFHYTFPEILFSSREIRDESDHVRRMNWAFLYGRRFDVEIWRCRGDLRNAPAYGAYMAKLIALRDRWPELLMTGRFVDEDFFDHDRQAFTAKGYTGDQRVAIVVWNHTAQEQRIAPTLRTPRRFVEGATVTGLFRPGDKLPAQSVAVLVYE